MIKILYSLITILGLFFSNAPWAQEKEIAIISMHGKWGAPPGPLAHFLQDAGFVVESPTMPWSRLRLYDVTYQDGLLEINTRVKQLKSRGYKKIVLLGHSFGANGVLAYTSQYHDIDAIVLIAPGHVPEIFYEYNRSTRDVVNARDMVASGRGKEAFSFTDPNSGNRSRTQSATASIYLSYFDPEGLGNMPQSAARISKSMKAIPALLINSTEDNISKKGEHYIFNQLQAHPLSVFIVSQAGHLGAPEANKDEVLKFIKSLK
jgi:esterase/lipase